MSEWASELQTDGDSTKIVGKKEIIVETDLAVAVEIEGWVVSR